MTESRPNAGSTFAGHRSVDDVTESDRQNTDGGEQRQPLQALQEPNGDIKFCERKPKSLVYSIFTAGADTQLNRSMASKS